MSLAKVVRTLHLKFDPKKLCFVKEKVQQVLVLTVFVLGEQLYKRQTKKIMHDFLKLKPDNYSNFVPVNFYDKTKDLKMFAGG